MDDPIQLPTLPERVNINFCRSRLTEVTVSGLFLLISVCLALWTLNPVRLERERLAVQLEFMKHLEEHGFRMEVK